MPKPVLVVIDVQERLFSAMDTERREEMVRNIKILGAAARRLGLPVLATEQYPKGLGPSRVILAGIEAHVCILLTALDLLGQGFHVSVVADAVASRTPAKLELGLAQARQAGAVVTATETVVFQLLGSADTEAFREIAKLLK